MSEEYTTLGSVLIPTMKLRWLKLEAWEIGGQKATPIFPLCHKLQQEWLDQTGQSNWRDIPIAEEESKTKNHECKVCGKPFENAEDRYEHYDQTHNHP